MNDFTSPADPAPADPALAPDQFAEPAMWPKTVGIISTVWGTLGLGCLGCLGAVMTVSMVFPQGLEQGYPDGHPPVLVAPALTTWVSMGMSLVNAAVLIAAGILLIMRKPIAHPVHLLYGVLGILFGAFGVWANVQHQQAITDWVNQNPGTKFASEQQAQGPINTAIMVAFMLLGFAWPVFCVVWFGAIKRDSAEISRGQELTV